MTEDEAKTKWCAFARIDVTAANRPNPGPKFDLSGGWPPCIASACMAWRKQRVLIDRATNEPAVPGISPIGQLEERYSAHGFCGLAGQP